MNVVVASLLDRSTRAQVRAFLGRHVDVQIHSCRKQALAALRTATPAALLTDVGADRALPPEVFLRLVHQQFPTLPVVAIVHLTSGDLRGLLRIAPVGVDEVIVFGVDSPWQVLQSVLRPPAIEASVETVLAALGPYVRPNGWPFVAFAVRAASTPLTVDDWSARLGMQRTTLLRKLRGVGLPAPTTLLTLGRLLVAEQLLAVHGWTVSQTAAALHDSSASALRKSLRCHTDIRPHQTRTEGGADHVMTAVRTVYFDWVAEQLA